MASTTAIFKQLRRKKIRKLTGFFRFLYRRSASGAKALIVAAQYGPAKAVP
jgi:hypothetical protein